MRLYIAKDYDEMSRVAASIIAGVVMTKKNAVLGLATGSTPIGTYKELVKLYNEGYLDFSEVHTANLDEYKGLSHESDQSYYYFMNDNLFSHVNIDKNNTNLPNGLAADANAECERYDKVIESLGGVDIQLLGIGHNGHIGFNEPCDTFPEGTHVVDLTESTINANARLFASKADVPTQAFTMGCGTIMKAKRVLLLANGKGKAEIINALVNGPVTPNVPASILKFHPNVDIIVDADAGCLL